MKEKQLIEDEFEDEELYRSAMEPDPEEFKIINRSGNRVILTGEFYSLRQAVEHCVKEKINLVVADLRGADLNGADLNGADLGNLDTNDLRVRGVIL